MPATSDNAPSIIELAKWTDPTGGINQSTRRSVIDDESLWWLENYFPLANGELRTAYGPGPPVYTAPPGLTICRIFFTNISGDPLGFAFLSDGTVTQFDLATGAQTSLGQIWGPATPPYKCDLKLWRPTYVGHTVGEAGGLVIGSPQGLYAWDGSTLTGPGQTPPLWLTNGQTTDEAGQPLVMPEGLPGIFAMEVYNQRLWVIGQTVISFSGPTNGADFSASGGGGSFGYFGDQLTVSYTDICATAGFLYIFGDSMTEWISNIQALGSVSPTTTPTSITSPFTTYFQLSNYNPQIGERFFRPVGKWLQALAVFDLAGVYILAGEGQMTWITQKVTNTWHALDPNPFSPTVCPVHVFGQRWLLFNGEFTDPWGVKRSLMLCWNGQIWTAASQRYALTHINYYEQDSCIDAYGTDGDVIVKLFAQPDPQLEKRIATKAYPGVPPEPLGIKNWKRLYVHLRDMAGLPEGSFLTGSFSTEGGGIPNGSEQVSFEVQPNVDDIRPHPLSGQGILGWLDLTSHSPDFIIERILIGYETRSIFGA